MTRKTIKASSEGRCESLQGRITKRNKDDLNVTYLLHCRTSNIQFNIRKAITQDGLT